MKSLFFYNIKTKNDNSERKLTFILNEKITLLTIRLFLKNLKMITYHIQEKKSVMSQKHTCVGCQKVDTLSTSLKDGCHVYIVIDSTTLEYGKFLAE